MGRRLALVVAVLACVLAAPGTASAVTCERVGLALIVSMDNNDLVFLTVSSGNIQVSDIGTPVACGGGASTVTNTGAILVSNQPGSSSGIVVIEDAGEFAPGAPTAQEPGDVTGTPEIEITVNLRDAPSSLLSVRDRGGHVRFGQSGINPNAGPGEVAPDVDIRPLNVRRLDGRGASSGGIFDPVVLGAQGGAATGAALVEGIELQGNGGNDQLTGGEGDDRLLSFNGNDSLVGLQGDDTLQPREDDDFVDGGPGADTVDYLLNQNIPSVAVDLSFVGPQNTGGGGTETIVNVENLDGTPGPDVLRGDDGANEIFASNGDDIIEGRAGKDTLQGWRGVDRIDARDREADTVDCGDDADRVVADAPGVDTLIDCEDVDFAAAGGGGGGGGGGGAAQTFGERTLVTLRLAARRIPAKGPLRVRVANANDFRVVAGVSAKRRKLKLGPRRIAVGPNSARTLNLRLPKGLRRLLARQGKATVRLNARVTDPLGNVRTLSKRPTLRLRRR